MAFVCAFSLSFPCTIILSCLSPMYTNHILVLENFCFFVNHISIILIQGVNSGRTYSPVDEEDNYIKGKSRKNANVRVDRSKRYEIFIINVGLLIFISSYWFLKVHLAAATFSSFLDFFISLLLLDLYNRNILFFQKFWKIPWILEHLWTSCH